MPFNRFLVLAEAKKTKTIYFCHFVVFRFSSVTDKNTQNKKDTREISRIFYAAIAPVNGTPIYHHEKTFANINMTIHKITPTKTKTRNTFNASNTEAIVNLSLIHI